MSTTARMLFYAPSLADDTRLETALELAAGRLSVDAWGGLWGDGVATLAAHMLLVSPEVAAGGDGMTRGQVTSEKAGDLSRNYGAVTAANVTLSEADLMRTSPGMQHLALRNSLAEVGFGVLF